MSPKRISKRIAGCFLLALLLAGTPLAAQEKSYLAAGKPDAVALLPSPPTPDTKEYAADLAAVQRVFKARTQEEEKRATKDSGLSVFIFARAIGPFLQPGKFPETEALYLHVKGSLEGTITPSKEHWKRARPYLVDTNLALGAPEKSYSYPSGHSVRGTVYALVLAEVFPEKREAILRVGEEIGWERVVIGKHFPSDIYAGRVVGKAIFRELMASPDFQKDLACAKAEARAALSRAGVK
jgi:acid phosphatase (class A)